MYHCFDSLRSSMATDKSISTSCVSVFVLHCQDDYMRGSIDHPGPLEAKGNLDNCIMQRVYHGCTLKSISSSCVSVFV